jgi:hypothetical protein
VPAAKRALPWSASEVREFYHDYGIIPDYTYALKAKLHHQQLESYAISLGLSRYFVDAEPEHPIGFDDLVDAEWWNPPASWSNAYVDFQPENEHVRLLRWSDGYVYFLSAGW